MSSFSASMNSEVSPTPVEPEEGIHCKYQSLYELSQDGNGNILSRCGTKTFDDEEENAAKEEEECLPCDADDLILESDPMEKIVEQEVQAYIDKTTADSKPEAKAARPLTVVDNLPDLPLQIGDHVYQWRSFAGIPGIFQHHGIVMDIGLDDNGEMELQIADFSCILRTPSNDHPSTSVPEISQTQSVDMLTGSKNNKNKKKRFNMQPHGILRVYNSSSKDPKWHKVHYQANVWKSTLWRSGTCTTVTSDPPAKVLARAYFLLEHPEVLPSYNIFRSNCECVALWCKTGFWSTLQASSLLSLTAAGQLKSTATIAAYAASSQVTIQTPAAGLWGYLGYTTSTQVSLLSTQPHLIPLLAAYGVVTAGGPTLVLWRAKRFWEQTTARLDVAFWEHALADPDIFAHSMMHWSERHSAFERN